MAIIPSSNPGSKAISLGGTQTCGSYNQSIEKELSGPGTAAISMNCTTVRNLLGVPSGTISFNNAYGKSSFPGKMLILAVGGGGGGGSLGGGGAGGYLSTTAVCVAGNTPFTVTIGSGGQSFNFGSGCRIVRGAPGTATIITGPTPTLSYTAYGGGGGASGASVCNGGTIAPTPYPPAGGGGVYCASPLLESPGYGISPYSGSGGGAGISYICFRNPVTTTYPGGLATLTTQYGGSVVVGANLHGQNFLGAGGGGAKTAGGNSTIAPESCLGPNRLTIGHGGSGYQWYDGNYYAGGGGGSYGEIYTSCGPGHFPNCSRYQGLGGVGGGGCGFYLIKCCTNPTSGGYRNFYGTGGTPGTGGGAGGGAESTPTSSTNTITGGPGVAIFIYSSPTQLATGGNSIVNTPTLSNNACVLPAPSIPTVVGGGPYWIHKFTTPGTFTT